MRIAYTDEQQALQRELRAYFSDLMTPERRAALVGGTEAGRAKRRGMDTGEYGDAYRDVVSRMGKDGWLALGWPTEYGGQNRSMMDQLIFTDEAAIAGAPVQFLTINSVAPTIMHYGTDEQKAYFLPKIAAGDLHFSIGYSEPGAGTDLANLRTTAVTDGDEYVINGQKMWTSLVPYADYIWLACRTDQSGLADGAKKHRGISVLTVPTTAPGFDYTVVHTMSGVDTSATYYSDVRVPRSSLVGEEGRGWALVTNQLNNERVALCSAAPIQIALGETIAWARESGLIEQQWVRTNLARVHAKVEFLKLINWKIASAVGSGSAPSPADASATKVFGTEFATEAYRLLMEIVGPAATLRQGSTGAHLAGRLERFQRTSLILTFGGGTNEVQRDIIAMTALKLPYSRR